ncbi:peptidoglycan-binding protein [Candidatus Kaiserbacteria bacterium]|nr:MAG: peptidoglycan-binding protein [Candidatus Kaiserbacteria bacterium]
MNITANTVVSKLFVAFVAASMLVMLASPAKAATAEELQAQIDALMAQISALQGSTAPAATPAAGCTFTRALTVGSQGADVKCLQDYLTPKYFTNAGGSTGYFGSVTAAAVAAWQTANGVMPAAGYFGPVSQAKYAALMAAAPDTDDSDDTDDTDGDNTSSDLSGEASLKTVEINNGDDRNNVEEGSTEVEVADINVEFSDGDAMITRLDIALVGDNTPTEADPWKVFGDVSLVIDGKTIKTIDASDKDNYLDEDDGSLRFSGLDIVGLEDEETTITVVVDVTDNLDGAGSDADWTVKAGSLRFVDAEDVTTTEGGTGDLEDDWTGPTADFSIDTLGSGDDLNLEDSDENPDATTIELSENDNTEEAIFAFDLAADDSDNAIKLDNLVSVVVTVAAAGPGSNLDTLVNDFRLEIGGESFSAESYSGAGSTSTIDFDINGDFTIDADDTVTAVLYADFNDMENADQGSTIFASVAPADIDAEGDDSGENVVVDGSTVTGATHTLRTSGLAVEQTSDTVTADENSDAITTDNAADFTLKFDVTSFGDSVYLPFGASASTTDLVDGVGYSIVNTNTNAIVATGTHIAGVSAAGGTTVTKTNSFKVGSGSSVEFTLTVNYDPVASGSYKLRLDTLKYASSDAATAVTTQDVSTQDIETDPITIAQ